MTRPNFRAWTVEPNAFFSCEHGAEQHAFLVQFAVLAPSSHNSQPWRFRVDDTGIDVLPEFRRRLPLADPDDNQLFVSLGCALEFLCLAARAYGFEATLSYVDGGAGGVRLDLQRSQGAADTLAEGHPLHAMLTRSTNRNPHRDQDVPEELVASVRAQNSEHVSSVCITEVDARRAIGELVVESVDACRSDRPFFRELAAYLLPNFSRRGVGMTGDTVGWGVLQSIVLPQAMKVMTPPPASRAERARYCEHTRAWAVIAATANTPLCWIETGRSYARIALRAESLGVSSNNLAGPIGVPSTREALARLSGSGGFAELCVRLGYCDDDMPHSPRLEAVDVIAPAD